MYQVHVPKDYVDPRAPLRALVTTDINGREITVGLVVVSTTFGSGPDMYFKPDSITVKIDPGIDENVLAVIEKDEGFMPDNKNLMLEPGEYKIVKD